MKLGTIIKFSDGRIGTVCWNHLDGVGGVWGVYKFEMPDGGFGDNLPAPEFMLRDESVKSLLVGIGHRIDLECVGEHNFEIIDDGDGT